MKFFAVLCVLCFGTAFAANETTDVDDIQFKVLGQSGKMVLERKSDPGVKVVIEVDSLREMDNKDVAIKGNDHKFENVASQSFTVKLTKDSIIPNTTIRAHKIEQNVTFRNTASLMLHSYLILADGIYQDQENNNVTAKKGQLKFTIEVKSWEFCTSCQGNQENGTFLDVNIKVTSKSNAKREQGNANRLDLGGGSTMDLNNMVKLDGQNSNMPKDYPKISDKGVMTFRFARFKDTASHDPTVTLGDAEQQTTTPRPPTTGASAHAPWMALILLLSIVKVLML